MELNGPHLLQQNENIQKHNVEWKNPETWHNFKCDAISIRAQIIPNSAILFKDAYVNSQGIKKREEILSQKIELLPKEGRSYDKGEGQELIFSSTFFSVYVIFYT